MKRILDDDVVDDDDDVPRKAGVDDFMFWFLATSATKSQNAQQVVLNYN